MFLHNKRMQYTVRVDQANPMFAKLLLDQFGGPNGELAAAMRYFTQGWAESDIPRRDMLLDIATEELSHLEMVGQMLTMLLKGTSASMIDEVEGTYLGDMLEGKQEQYAEMGWALSSGQMNNGGSGPRLVDSMGTPFTAAYIDTIGQPTADLRSDIAAEARAKIVYERLIKQTDDAGCRDTLNFLMTREIAHQKMFEAALAAIEPNFPPGKLQGKQDVAHMYFKDSKNGVSAQEAEGPQLVTKFTDWGFEIIDETQAQGDEPQLPDPKPSVESMTAK
jgi:Mn-containing catalase